MDDDGYPIMRKLVLAAPKGIVDAIRPIVDPDQLRQFDAIRGLQNAQGVIKTGMLSFALFHDKAMAIQTLASEKGWATMANLFSDLENNVMDQPSFRGNEMYFTGRGLETAPVHDVEDIMRGLELNKGILEEALNAPVAKQLVDLSKLHTTFLFDKFQRYIKVMTCTRNMAAWDARFPEATTEQRDAAASGFAKATNATFGGLNWANLGITRTQLSVMRMTLLAPDWVVSAIKMANYGLTDWGKTPMKALVGQAMDATAGQQARGTMFKAIVGGYLFGNAMSYLLHNTFMSDNKKGHHNEVEVAPDVYFSPFAGGPGEIVKLLSDIKESGGGKGSARYVQGKFAPAFSAGVTALSGVNYYGGNIWKGKSELARDVHATWDVASHLLPLPISLTGGINYAQREQDQSALGWAAMGLGLGRFSKPSGKGKSSGGLNLEATYERQRQNVFKTEANQ